MRYKAYPLPGLDAAPGVGRALVFTSNLRVFLLLLAEGEKIQQHTH